jgi:arabinose-5-phosphate isomerase
LNRDDVFRRAREILNIESRAIERAARRLGTGFWNLAQDIFDLKGKVLVSGVGKSGIVAEKIAATLSSTGTPAFYINPLNALHGDLGVARAGDLLLAVSNSGESTEMLGLIGAARNLGVKVAALTGNPDATMAGASDYVLDAGVEREACPLGLAPTASTTVCLALGDALAMVVMEMREFRPEDFAKFHPGGALRKRLRLCVKDIMRTRDRVPCVPEDASLEDALREMTEKEALGVTLVTAPDGPLLGILTDGDLRRILLREEDTDTLRQQPVGRFMTRNPKSIEPDAVASEALRIMEVKGITSLAIVDSRSHPVGIIHLHDILGRGSFSV